MKSPQFLPTPLSRLSPIPAKLPPLSRLWSWAFSWAGQNHPEEFARFLGGGVLGFVGGLFTEPPGQQPRLTPAEYQAALDACLASATTLAEYYTCADAVDRRAFGP